MQPVQLRILSGRHFEETFQNTQGEKSNKCKQCGFASYLPGNMRRHVLTHSGKKSNKCNQCNYASSQAGNLRTHLKTHSGEKTNKCNQCDYASVEAGDLRKHLKTHSGEKSNKCNQCDLRSQSFFLKPAVAHSPPLCCLTHDPCNRLLLCYRSTLDCSHLATAPGTN